MTDEFLNSSISAFRFVATLLAGGLSRTNLSFNPGDNASSEADTFCWSTCWSGMRSVVKAADQEQKDSGTQADSIFLKPGET